MGMRADDHSPGTPPHQTRLARHRHHSCWDYSAAFRRSPASCGVRRRRSRIRHKTRKVDFNREVRPILAKNCFACHGQDEAKRAKGLRLDRRDAAVKPLKSGETAIVPGDPDSSELILRVTEEDETLRMPPRKSGSRLTPAEVDVLEALDRAKGPNTPRTGR